MARGTQTRVDEEDNRLRERLSQQKQQVHANIIRLEHDRMDPQLENLLFGKVTDHSMLLPGLKGRSARDAFVDIHEHRKLLEIAPVHKPEPKPGLKTAEKEPIAGDGKPDNPKAS